ncbi:MAG: radical SAM protein [Pseudomonadota bacterium]
MAEGGRHIYETEDDGARPLGPFVDPIVTASGERRASVKFAALQTLWINTGTLCNLACKTCYIESSPTNDALVYPSLDEIAPFLHEAKEMGAREIGFTGGEPFLNPHAPDLIETALDLGFDVLVLTNAMRPMTRPHVAERLLTAKARHGDRLVLRVSLDGSNARDHDAERGDGAFQAALDGLKWLTAQGFRTAIAGRLLTDEDEAATRDGFARLFAREGLPFDAASAADLVVFPQMDANAATPEITDACWRILGKRPEDVMCASSRMVVKRKGAAAPSVLACTLIADDPAFELGATLEDATRAPVPLNHPHCSRFCVLGGASCSGGDG